MLLGLIRLLIHSELICGCLLCLKIVLFALKEDSLLPFFAVSVIMDSRLIRGRVFPKKPLLLKDFLLDNDFGSCSSNGFKSFPRRQCCSSLPFLHEFDSKAKKTRKLGRSSFSHCAISAAFRSVFAAAVKRLPFPGGSESPEKKKIITYSFLPRRMRSGFWRRKPAPPPPRIERWKSFDQLLMMEDCGASNGSCRWPAAVSRFAAAAAAAAAEEYMSGNADLDDGCAAGEVNDVVEDDKTAESGGSEEVATNDVVLLDSTTASDACSVATNSPTNPKMKQQWPSEEKEQFSPMSVLDYSPFNDDDEELLSSPFQQRLARMEGTRKKLMKKIHMFESLAKLEPVNLATRFIAKHDSDSESSSVITEKSISDLDNQCEDTDDKVETIDDDDDEWLEIKATELLCQINKAIASSYYNNVKLNPQKMLLDFFKERLLSNQDKGIIEEAFDWMMQGRRRGGEATIESDSEKNMQSYVKDMERGGQWRTLDQEIKEVAFVLETEVFDVLLDEVLIDILA
ncbi:uncharacterized protein LOC127255401 [Andrographis paniculata]|uniref:uncharacterized protein LOC127255401 n=1 Tax=Andrographis paniculata TaxID=175694 RepID=UPI0021E99986|nr:uncharacterized protein LOC127255401 [Andrographis paniculata]